MIFGWAVFVLEGLLACGVVGAAFFYGKRIGGLGPYVLAMVPVIAFVEHAVVKITPYAIHEIVARGGMFYRRIDGWSAGVASMTTSVPALMAVLLVTALVLMRR